MVKYMVIKTAVSSMEGKLNELALQGWRLVAVSPLVDYGLQLCVLEHTV